MLHSVVMKRQILLGCCDACGRWCHLSCVHLAEVPSGDYICPMCQNQHQPTNIVTSVSSVSVLGRLVVMC